MLRLSIALALVVVVASGCCSSGTGFTESRECRKLRQNTDKAREGWRNAHDPDGFVDVRRTLHYTLRVGMTTTDVRRALGEPLAADTTDGHVVWTYAMEGQDSVRVDFEDEALTDWTGRAVQETIK